MLVFLAVRRKYPLFEALVSVDIMSEFTVKQAQYELYPEYFKYQYSTVGMDHNFNNHHPAALWELQ